MNILIKSFKDSPPSYNKDIAFVCPGAEDRWTIGWVDNNIIRIEGGESYKFNELTYYFELPKIPDNSIKEINNYA